MKIADVKRRIQEAKQQLAKLDAAISEKCNCGKFRTDLNTGKLRWWCNVKSCWLD